ncbi:MAG: sortase domain-bontaining protein [Chloroflexota bacterium]
MRIARAAALATVAAAFLTIAVLAAAVTTPHGDRVPSDGLPNLGQVAGATATPLATASTSPTTSATPSPRPSATPSPAASDDTAAAVARNGPRTRVATRVVVNGLGIDLPVVPGRPEYPACDVAMYLGAFRQPGQGGPTYLYAHARTGMFLPLLTQSRISNGAGMIGLTVDVYTGDGQRFTYRIDRVYRHTTSLDGVTARHGERLWLQTSEGPHGTIPKLQVTARYVSRSSASYAASHPLPRPLRCG